MRASVVTAHGGIDTIVLRDDYPTPRALAHEVIVKVKACALNFHDIFSRRGMPGIKVPLPVITGSDIAGEIVEIGPDVEGWSLGDRILVDPLFQDGVRYGIIGEVADGGRAEYVAVHKTQLIAIPEGVTFDQAAALPLAYGTAYRMMVTRGQVKQGDKVLVLGASGGVGVSAVQIAKMAGATVLACASSQDKLDKLAAIGADHLIDYSARSIREAVADAVGKPRVSGEGGVDIAINFTGGDTWVDTQRCVALGGKILTCGATAGFDVRQDMRYLWTFEHTVLGSNGWAPRDLTDLLDLVAQGRLDPAISERLPLDAIPDAERRMEARQIFGKVLFIP